MHTYQFKVEGLTCQACQKIIQKKLGKVTGVNGVSVELDGKLEIKSEREIAKSELVEALKDTDYKIV